MHLPPTSGLTSSRLAIRFGAKAGVCTKAEAPAPAPKKPVRKWKKRMVKWTGRSLIGFLTGIGTMEVANNMAHDGRISQLMPLSVADPELEKAANTNSTAALFNQETITPAEAWKALEPTRKLVNAVSPDIARWFEQYYREDRLRFNDGTVTDAQEIFKWSRLTGLTHGELRFNQRFWLYTDGEKASIIARAYRQAQQNSVKNLRLALMEQPVRWVQRQISNGGYGNRQDDEVNLFHRDALDALGIRESNMGTLRWNVEEYLRYRNMSFQMDPEQAKARKKQDGR